MIQNADPTGERVPDSPEMLNLEEQCKAMGPLIDTELEQIDKSVKFSFGIFSGYASIRS